MVLAALKLADILARSLFILVALYTLEVQASGRLGLTLTLIGFFGFLAGFERYGDLQRRLVGQPARAADALVATTLRFFAVNHLVWLPVLALLLAFWVGYDWWTVALLLVVALSEHLSNEAYRIALIAPHFRRLLSVVLAKDAAMAVVVVSLSGHGRGQPQTADIVQAWAAASLLALVAMAWLARASLARDPGIALARLGLREQYRASRIHFMIGFVALASLQADRLLAGAVLALADVGVYFRHVYLAAFAYQALGVVSHNRVLHRIYDAGLRGRLEQARAVARREAPLLLGATGVGFLICLLVIEMGSKYFPVLTQIRLPLLALLMLAFMVRAFADFQGALLNAAYRERDVFVAQASMLGASILLNLLLSTWAGVFGTATSVALSMVLYLALTATYTRRALDRAKQGHNENIGHG